jgi:hypothetical protein
MTGSKRICLQAVTRAERHLMVEAVSAAIGSCGGWVLDFNLFSNIAISIAFEIPAGQWDCLVERFAKLDWRLDQPPAGLDDRPGDLSVSLHLTFIHNEGDLRRPIPSIPG